MMHGRDFTLVTYRHLLIHAVSANYEVVSVLRFVQSDLPRALILRHDVDKRSQYALRMANIEHELGLKGTYYFRTVESRFDPSTIRRISKLGHEIGYHYEDLTSCGGNVDEAIDSFAKNLETLREFYPVRTICMHGSPLSKWDNRLLWQSYDYKSFGVVAEPYLDLDFSTILYLTDTGRGWNCEQFSVRDKLPSGSTYRASHTNEIGVALSRDELPDRIMLTIHPQRWTDDWLPWFAELVSQSVKNVAKRVLVASRGRAT